MDPGDLERARRAIPNIEDAEPEDVEGLRRMAGEKETPPAPAPEPEARAAGPEAPRAEPKLPMADNAPRKFVVIREATPRLGEQKFGKALTPWQPVKGKGGAVRAVYEDTPELRATLDREGKLLVKEDQGWAKKYGDAASRPARAEPAPPPPLYSREEFAADLRDPKVWGLSDEEARTIEAITDARANMWSKRTGRDPVEWYTETLASVAEGQPLFQRQAAQGAKGGVSFLDDGRAILHAFEGADISTVAHELGHVFRRELSGEDLQTASKWATGAIDGVWDEVAEEKWARAFERYLAEGEAPSAELMPVFERFKEWLLEIYRAITGSDIDVELTDEVRGTMDRLLAEAPEARPNDFRGWELEQIRNARAEDAARELRRVAEEHPLSLEDARRIYGTDDWLEVQALVERQAQQHTLLSTPRDIRAQIKTHAKLSEPKYVERFGKTEKVTRERILSDEAARMRYWELQGVSPPPKLGKKGSPGYAERLEQLNEAKRQAEAFRKEQKAFADWYYSLAEGAGQRASGQSVNMPAPEWLARKQLEQLGQLQQAEQARLYQRAQQLGMF